MGRYSLVGVDGNAFAVMAYVAKAMEKEGKTVEEIRAYCVLAEAGDYNNLLCVSQDVIDALNH